MNNDRKTCKYCKRPEASSNDYDAGYVDKNTSINKLCWFSGDPKTCLKKANQCQIILEH